MNANEIAQWVIDNRYPKSEHEKTTDSEMYNEIVEMVEKFHTAKVESVTDEMIRAEAEKRNPYIDHLVDYNNGLHEGIIDGAEWLKQELKK